MPLPEGIFNTAVREAGEADRVLAAAKQWHEEKLEKVTHVVEKHLLAEVSSESMLRFLVKNNICRAIALGVVESCTVVVTKRGGDFGTLREMAAEIKQLTKDWGYTVDIDERYLTRGSHLPATGEMYFSPRVTH